MPDILEDTPTDAVYQMRVQQPIAQLLIADSRQTEGSFTTQCELTAAWCGKDFGHRDVREESDPRGGDGGLFALFGVGKGVERMEPGGTARELLAAKVDVAVG